MVFRRGTLVPFFTAAVRGSGRYGANPVAKRPSAYHIDRCMPERAPASLGSVKALKVIRELASDSRNIVVIGHGRKRQRQRNITRRQIELCLQRGSIVEGPFVNRHGHWQVTMFRHAAGEEVNCVVAIEWAARLLVITLF